MWRTLLAFFHLMTCFVLFSGLSLVEMKSCRNIFLASVLLWRSSKPISKQKPNVFIVLKMNTFDDEYEHTFKLQPYTHNQLLKTSNLILCQEDCYSSQPHSQGFQFQLGGRARRNAQQTLSCACIHFNFEPIIT